MSPLWVVSDEERVISIVNGWVGKVPHSPRVQGFNIYGGNKICSSKDDGLGDFGRCSQPLGWFQIPSYIWDKDIIMLIVAFSQLIPSDGPASSKVSLSSLTKVVSSLILALRAMI